jgi:signal transduction histidine kinase
MDFLNNCSRVLISARDNQLSVETISKIVRALKSYTYLDQSQERSVDLNEDLENTLTILHSQIPSQVTVVRKFNTLPVITCQGSELNQVWTNLIQNALQALGEQEGIVTVETATDAQHVLIRVIDNGPGISDEIKSKVFDPFFTTQRGARRGLGLSIVQQIVKRHHGTVHIDSVPGHTCVEIALPKTGI